MVVCVYHSNSTITMTAIASLIAFDGAGTPVSHTFLAEGIEDDPITGLVARWKEVIGSTPEYASNRCTLTKRKLKSGVTRVAMRVEIPIMESISGQNASGYTAAPKVAYVDAAEFVAYAHPRSTTLGRRLVRQLLVNLANGVATTVTPNTSSQPAEAFDALLMPT